LWRRFDEADLVARYGAQLVEVLEGVWREGEARVKVGEDNGDESVGGCDVGLQQWTVLFEELGCREWSHVGEDVIF